MRVLKWMWRMVDRYAGLIFLLSLISYVNLLANEVDKENWLWRLVAVMGMGVAIGIMDSDRQLLRKVNGLD